MIRHLTEVHRIPTLFTLLLLVVLLLAARQATGQEAFPDWQFYRVGDVELPEYAAGFVLAESPDTDQVILFGGSYGATWLDTIRAFTIPAGSWNILPEVLPYPYRTNERHGAAQASNGKFYLGPGNGPGGWGQNDQIIEIDLFAGTVIERAPIVGPGSNIWGIAVVAAPASRGGVYLFGGWNGGGVASIRHYDPSTDHMTSKGSLSYGRTVGDAVAHPNGRIYLFGGNRGPTVVEVFDTTDETIRTIPNPDGWAFNHGTQGWTSQEGLIYLWNPNAEYLGASADSIIGFDPDTETLANLGSTPWPDAFPISASRDPDSDAVYFFGFVAPGSIWGVSGILLGEVWKLEPPPSNEYPIADAGPDQVLAADAACEALATLDASGSFDPDDDPLIFEWDSAIGSASGAVVDYTVPLGSFEFTVTVDDGHGGTDSDSMTVIVQDTTGPGITSLVASPDVLWPPNHNMKNVEVSVVAADACDLDPPWCRITEVTSDEPMTGGGTGNHAPDWEITGDLTVNLRAERSGQGDGRTYTIEITCTDAPLNDSTASVLVTVPHDQSE